MAVGGSEACIATWLVKESCKKNCLLIEAVEFKAEGVFTLWQPVAGRCACVSRSACFVVLYPSNIDARVFRTWWRWVPRTHTIPSVIAMTMSTVL